ncbi:MAG: dihydrofolate reductase family protein [Solirubrobacteraceae bacterium]
MECRSVSSIQRKRIGRHGDSGLRGRDLLPGSWPRPKEQPGKDIAVGGSGLAGACMKLGLIDEWRLFVSPVLLGGGTMSG